MGSLILFNQPVARENVYADEARATLREPQGGAGVEY